MVIYLITNKIDGKRYVGQTTIDVNRRFTQHCCKTTNTYISNAIKKHGRENFSLEVIKTCSTIEELNTAEELAIVEYNSLVPNGYNILHGGNNFNRVFYPMQGKTHSEETKAKMSASAKGKKKSPEHVAKMRKSKTGHKLSAEICKKMSEIRLGKSKRGRKIICVDTGEIFKSVTEASKLLKIPRRTINRSLWNVTKKSKFPKFEYL